MSLQLQAKLKTASAEYQRLQADLSNVVEARQRLDAQLSENDLVKKVATLCGRSGRNYNRDQAEAKSNVETRLEFIKGRNVSQPLKKRVEAQLQDVQSKSDKKKNELVEIQAALQQTAQQAPPPGAPLPSLGA
ncbi:prefoldin subunit 6 [Mycena olivaceomarginata]|nr:prefoldin subunit 6 [Mycena olivaceomarginata]